MRHDRTGDEGCDLPPLKCRSRAWSLSIRSCRTCLTKPVEISVAVDTALYSSNEAIVSGVKDAKLRSGVVAHRHQHREVDDLSRVVHRSVSRR